MCNDCGCSREEKQERLEDKKLHLHLYLNEKNYDSVHLHIHSEHIYSHGHDHTHKHGHDHTHGHSHEHSHDSTEKKFSAKKTKTLEIQKNILMQNDNQAQINREWLKSKNVVALNLISSPGSGKTLLLEKTLEALRGKIKCAVITGDQQTDNDARRMMNKGADVVQIQTKTSCHLTAQQVFEKFEQVVKTGVKLLFIENVGNLVCPSAFDLGETHKIALVSIAEGEDKPEKYPSLFHDSPVTVITKVDLLSALDANLDKYRNSIKKVRPDSQIIEVSAKTGEGMQDWLNYLSSFEEK